MLIATQIRQLQNTPENILMLKRFALACAHSVEHLDVELPTLTQLAVRYLSNKVELEVLTEALKQTKHNDSSPLMYAVRAVVETDWDLITWFAIITAHHARTLITEYEHKTQLEILKQLTKD